MENQRFSVSLCLCVKKQPSPTAEFRFNEVLKPRYAVQVAVEAEGAGVNPLEYAGRPVKVSAADFLSVLI